jgi:hypothetical protein
MLDGCKQAIGLDKLRKDVLKDILGVELARDALQDEAAQPRPLELEGLLDPSVLLALGLVADHVCISLRV